ncbi:DNA primase [candidate division WOR-1 bacterium RIFOXYA12_FULL_43_27]|uniref:DNA primase n=1 Tax=candidate division WOR-1 bacterium RIFOXYC2_FULL_46_14 TaxID=1802587 RepID=A0A1F4U4J8_UNCSA|nr:MAG: DNA primase [candidate division WOR-1 bacterium RIFOXYA12_FULL_43_27]OGC20908.1 MAG: DNA primase [candidate division WOR-1 bacterium RIFOXYB2_FULL_46_45]OGC31354.1 MAG: DNA primase [candidate division WOR-1 bacterium RIFOXYA2_FULL_46_56]OGC39760.1 MAG: DNA primase [candidate division WOR-1 bacterium RIFOXYC2_FULL_46_14]
MAQINLKEITEEIKNRANILEVVSGYVQLKKRGKNYLGLCPFHSEKTASFTVSEEKGLFHCFGCGEGGRVIDFVMKIEKVDFVEALKILGEKLGIEVNLSGLDPAAKDKKQRLFDLMEAACKFFEGNLDNKIVGYFEKRGLEKKTVSSFRIGFALDGWDNLLNFFIKKGFDPKDLETAGLIIPKEGRREYFDRFRNRIIFPIFDQRGRTVGFSGRAFGEFEPKYLNSPDSPIFQKGENLFGLNFARDEIKKKKYAILVEGNVDLMMCHRHGFLNTVAPLGTAFTHFQAKLLKRLTDQVVIAFDSDTAGELAAEKAEAILKEAEVEVKIATMEKSKDPADFLKENGSEKFFELLKNSRSALAYRIDRTFKKFNLSQIEGRAKAAEAAAAILAVEKNEIVRKEYLKSTAKTLGIDFDTLLAETRKKSFYQSRKGGAKGGVQKPNSKTEEAEKCLVRLAFENADLREKMKEQVDSELFFNPLYRRIIATTLSANFSGIDDLAADEEKSAVRQILLKPDDTENRPQMIFDCINTLKKEKIKADLAELRIELSKKEAENDPERLKGLQERFSKLSEISRSL